MEALDFFFHEAVDYNHLNNMFKMSPLNPQLNEFQFYKMKKKKKKKKLYCFQQK